MMKTFVVVLSMMSTAASAQYYSPYNNQYLPQPRMTPPTYLPSQQFNPPQFNPSPPQPTFGNLPAYNNYCMSLGGQLTTNCNR